MGQEKLSSFSFSLWRRDISKAELKLGDYRIRYWRKPAKHIFECVIWSPDARLKLVLKGGKTVNIDLPPLDGLMERQDKGSEIMDLLFNHTSKDGLGNGSNGTHKDHSDLVFIPIHASLSHGRLSQPIIKPTSLMIKRI